MGLAVVDGIKYQRPKQNEVLEMDNHKQRQ